MKRFLGVAILACLVFAAGPGAVAAASHPTARPKAKVKIADFAFSPKVLTIKAGTKVVWTNKGPSTHTTTSDDGRWDSPPLAPGQKFKFIFTVPGTYPYHCSIHPTMTAEVDVTT